MEEFISVGRAEALIAGALRPFTEEEIPLEEVLGRVMRRPVVADRDQPPFNRVMMDGVSFRVGSFEAGRRRFRVAGVARAGEAALVLEDPEACFEVMTGAVLPDGCDCVAPVEQIVLRGNEVELRDEARVEPMQFIDPQGNDYRRGDTLLSPGKRLSAPAVAVAASAGCATLAVSRVPRVAVVATGDELVEVGEAVASHQIRRSNDYAIVAALRSRGYFRNAACHVRDVRERLRQVLTERLEDSDVLILTGGVSMGRFDYVPEVLHAVGVKALFHKVKQRPGKPLLFGLGSNGQAVFALPGNPVSALVCLYRYVLPQFDRSSGVEPVQYERVSLARAFSANTDLTCFLPVGVAMDATGRPVAEPRPVKTSGDFASLAATDGFVELEGGRRDFPQGYVARLFRWSP